MKQILVLNPIFYNKPRKTQDQIKPKAKMIARVSHDDIKVWKPRKSYR